MFEIYQTKEAYDEIFQLESVDAMITFQLEMQPGIVIAIVLDLMSKQLIGLMIKLEQFKFEVKEMILLKSNIQPSCSEPLLKLNNGSFFAYLSTPGHKFVKEITETQFQALPEANKAEFKMNRTECYYSLTKDGHDKRSNILKKLFSEEEAAAILAKNQKKI